MARPKGIPAWNKGKRRKKYCNGCNKQINPYNKYILCRKCTHKSLEYKIRKRESMLKEKHWNWKGGLTNQDRPERSKFRDIMRDFIFKRDNYQCQICDSKKNLQVDHIQSWAEFKELRFDPENCRTLCQKCHYKITYKRKMPENIKSWGQNFKEVN